MGTAELPFLSAVQLAAGSFQPIPQDARRDCFIALCLVDRCGRIRRWSDRKTRALPRGSMGTFAGAILAGLAPIMWSRGSGAEVMQRIAAPMIGGMITAPLLSMIVVPVVYRLLRRPSAMAGRVSAA